MKIHHHIRMWLHQKLWSKPQPHNEEETVAVPEVHTGKVHHTEDPHPHHEAIHYDNVAIPEIHIPHKK